MKKNIIFTTIIILLTFVSCSEPDFSAHENDSSMKSISGIERYGFVSVQLFDEFLSVGEDKFNKQLNELNTYIQDNNLENISFTASEYSDLIVTYFKIDKSIIEEYISLTIKYSKNIKDNSNNEQELFKSGFYKYIEITKSDNKGLFTFIANLTGAGCVGQVLAGMLDTSIAATAMILTAPTGVGLVVGAIGTAAEYGNLIVTIYNCTH